jgi:hypothetical protein
MCRPQESLHGQGRTLPISQHVPICKSQTNLKPEPVSMLISQLQVNVASLENVVRFYLNLAEEKTEAARQESHQAVVDIDDLDNVATPENILLR